MVKFKWEKEFKETPIGKIPRDWDIQSIDDITNKLPGAAFSSKYFNKEGRGLPLIRIRDLGKRTTEAYYEGPYEKEYVVNPGDILIGMDGAFDVHKWKGPIGLLNQRVLKIWPKDQNSLDKEYLYYASIIPVKAFEEQVVGTTVAHLLMSHLKYIYIPIPPTKEEQERIATVLSWFDNLIENKRRQNEILEKTAMAIFKSWFIDFEPFQDEEFVYSEELDMEIPKGWEVKPIGEVAEFFRGLSYKGSEKFEKAIPDSYVFITLNNIKEEGGFRPRYSWIKSQRLKPRHFLKEFDLVMANTHFGVGGLEKERLLASPAIVFFPPGYSKNIGVYSHHITKISLIDSTLKFYVYLYLKFTKRDSVRFATGTGVLGLDIENFKINKLIIIPPKPILEKFHSLVEPLFRKIIINEKEIMVLKKAHDTLLPQLVFGRLRVEEV